MAEQFHLFPQREIHLLSSGVYSSELYNVMNLTPYLNKTTKDKQGQKVNIANIVATTIGYNPYRASGTGAAFVNVAIDGETVKVSAGLDFIKVVSAASPTDTNKQVV